MELNYVHVAHYSLVLKMEPCLCDWDVLHHMMAYVTALLVLVR